MTGKEEIRKVEITRKPNGKCKVTKKIELKRGEKVTFSSNFENVEVTIPDKRVLDKWRFEIGKDVVTRTVKKDAPIREFDYVVICFDNHELGEGGSNPRMKIKD